MLDRVAFGFYKLLLVLAGIALIGAFVSIMLNISARIFGWNIPGLDGYAGYTIAAALFLALPSTLQHNEHIRATLLLDHVSPGTRGRMEVAALVLGTGIALFLAWFSVRLVWVSYTLHDVAPTGDATPMWIPQLSMALGCIGFAMAFVQALWSHFTGKKFFVEPGGEASHAD
ncbi:TRAP transporter small permease [Piscinibacter sakaiensis]|uniref:TRAP transporter small permease n=1 Tax=Piscinibacter sakaiensis TaxID=1547922 RepID=UPI003AAEC98D